MNEFQFKNSVVAIYLNEMKRAEEAGITVDQFKGWAFELLEGLFLSAAELGMDHYSKLMRAESMKENIDRFHTRILLMYAEFLADELSPKKLILMPESNKKSDELKQK